MTETGGAEDVTHSPLKGKSPNKSDAQPMDVQPPAEEVRNTENETITQGTSSSVTSAFPCTPTPKRMDSTSFKTPDPVTPTSSAKKRKRLTPEERNLREMERQEKRRKLEEEKQKKEQERLEKARQKEEEKQRKEEEKRRLEEEKRLERLKKEEERKKFEEEKKQERLKKEEERKRLEEEKVKERLKKEEEKKKKEDERRQKIEEKEREQKKIEEKQAKQAQLLKNFLVKPTAPKVQTIIDDGNVYLATGTITAPNATDLGGEKSGISVTSVADAPPNKNSVVFNPLPFQIKVDMGVAPLCRREKMSAKEKSDLDSIINCNDSETFETSNAKQSDAASDLLKSIKNGGGRKCARTEVRHVKDCDVQVLEDNIEKPECVSGYVKWRIKLLQFHDNRRPAYWGTWKRIPKRVTARKPLAREEEVDYDFDSDDEWEDEPEDAEEIVDSDKDEKDDHEDGGDEEEEEGWMVPHGYLSDSEREGAHVDLESMKNKEKEFYKTLTKKALMEFPFIETTNLACFAIRVCPVFRSAEPVKPVRKRAKPKPKVEALNEVKSPETPTTLVEVAVPTQNPVAVSAENKTKRIRKVPVNKPNPYAPQPSGFLAMELPSDDEDDMDWEDEDDLSNSTSSDSEDEKEGNESSDESSSDEDLFIPIVKKRPISKE